VVGQYKRMDQARPARNLLDWKRMGTRPVGRSRQRWQEDVMQDFKKAKVKTWNEIAKDRRTWSDLAPINVTATAIGNYWHLPMLSLALFS
jgi:hypothetical protein